MKQLEKFCDHIDSHHEKLNHQILLLSSIYLILSVVWNVVFLLLEVPYSRANLYLLAGCLIVCFVLLWIRRLVPIKIMSHVVLSFVLLAFTSLYFGSGFSEAWTYFLIVPVIAGLYGATSLLLTYSLSSFIVLCGVSVFFPIQPSIDSIDFSNQLLLHIIITTFSFMIIYKLKALYKKQLEIVEESAEMTIEQVVKTFAVSVEAKDMYTFGHSERVSQYAVELAKSLPEFQDEKKLHRLRLMGLLHDIGKINIHESILSKSSALTKEEYELIKTHTNVGARMVEKVEGLEGLKSGVLYHHERWDGKGYPTQAKELDIPLESRILALADAFDAMTSTRAYRNAMSEEEAFQRILDGRGTQFDPELVDKLEMVKHRWFKICQESKDELEGLEKVLDIF